MSTILYHSPIFGPVHSRRLGVSLGINLQPADGKVCTFDCIYCECGLNKEHTPHAHRPSREAVAEALEQTLKDMHENNLHIDVLTFAGNGEPTGHPQFAEIIDDTLRIRDKYFPTAKISVLSNSTFIHRESVHNALMKVDNNILKLDSAVESTMRAIDRPANPDFTVERVVEQLRQFSGECIIQTMMLRGTHCGVAIDNTTDDEIDALISAYRTINPREVMLYSLDRPTPESNLQRIERPELDAIADRMRRCGIKIQVN